MILRCQFHIIFQANYHSTSCHCSKNCGGFKQHADVFLTDYRKPKESSRIACIVMMFTVFKGYNFKNYHSRFKQRVSAETSMNIFQGSVDTSLSHGWNDDWADLDFVVIVINSIERVTNGLKIENKSYWNGNTTYRNTPYSLLMETFYTDTYIFNVVWS